MSECVSVFLITESSQDFRENNWYLIEFKGDNEESAFSIPWISKNCRNTIHKPVLSPNI